jgi:PAS domain S-box-containing protein
MNVERKTKFRDMKDSFLLELILNATNEAIVVVDKDGYIEELSDAYAEFLGGKKETMIGKNVTEVIENTRMHIVLQTEQPEIASVQEIHGQNIIATRFPIVKDGKVLGALGRVLFKNTVELNSLYGEINRVEQELSLYKDRFGCINSAKYTAKDLIGESASLKALKETILRVAKGNSNILILGESGTGKELFAHAIHAASRRSEEALICINCASIPSELMESEFFGYEEGAFTGARKGGKIGLFKAADKGTLFLDEIGDLPMSMQVKLLRVLQDKEVRKIGSNIGEAINVRIVAATNRNLHDLMNEGQFRSDLFYRLNVVGLNIPPLRERSEDITVLAEYLINKISERDGILVQGISTEAIDALKKYNWPGNVRELENVLERAVNFLDTDRMIKLKQLDMKVTGKCAEEYVGTLKEITETVEKNAIITTLRRLGGKKTLAAKELGISRTSLYEKLEKYGLL